MNKLDPDRCCESVCGAGTWGAFHPHQCERKWKVKRKGKPYCTQHDPVKVKERDEKKQQKWDKEWKEKTARFALNAAAPEMYDLLSTIENDDGKIPKWLWDKIQAVLSKARDENE